MAPAPWKSAPVASAPSGAGKKPFADRVSPETKARLAELSAITQNPAAAEYEALPGWQKPLVAASDIVSLMASAPLLGFGEKAVAGLRAPFTGKTYEEELAEQRRQITGARKRSGWAGTTGEVASQVATLPSLAVKGGGAVLRAGAGALEGAGYGAASALGEDRDVASGALWGAGGGAGGSAFADLVKAGGTKVSKAVSNYLAEPTARAKQAIWEAAQAAGLKAADIRDAIRKHGEEVVTADVLKKRGTSMAKTAANVSPEARETLETFSAARKSGQNERVVGTLEDIAGIPQGTRKTVPEFKQAAYDRAAPEIDAAYEEARKAGYDLPRTMFEDILTSPMGRQAYDEAATSLLNRKAASGIDATSELARLDQTKRRLDAIADTAYRAGDKDKGAQASALAKKLRDTMDASIAGPEYAKARGLRQSAYEREKVIDTGAALAGGRIPASLPGQARTIARDPDSALGLKQSYALQQSENLLNKGSTEGALSALERPLQREAYEAALGESAPQLTQRLETEKMFNRTNRDIVGGSSTTRQLLEAVGVGGASALGSWATGAVDPLTGGLLGAGVKGGRILAPFVQRALQTKAAQTAPEIASELIRSPSAIPSERVIPPGVLEQGVGAVRDYLAQLIAKGSINVGARGERGL